MSWCMITSNIASVGTRSNLLVSSEYLKNLNPACWLVVGRTALTFFPLSSPFWSFKCNCALVITNLSKDKQVLKPGNHEVNVIHDMVAKQDILYLLENFCAYTWLFYSWLLAMVTWNHALFAGFDTGAAEQPSARSGGVAAVDSSFSVAEGGRWSPVKPGCTLSH